MSELPPDPYKALGLAKDTTPDAVRKTFRKLALTCHPDKTKALPESERKKKEEQFHCIKNAHDILVDEDERKRYDLKVEREALLRRPTYGPSKSQQSQPPTRPQPTKSTTQPIFKSRGDPVFEYREPKRDRDVKTSTYEYDNKARFETRRPPARNYDDHYYDDVSGGSRRASGRTPDKERERERSRRDEDEKMAKKIEEQRIKERERRLREDLARAKDRARKEDVQQKQTRYNRAEASSSEEDSEVEAFMKPQQRTSHRRSPERKPAYDDRRHDSHRSSRRDEDKPRRRSSEEDDSTDVDKHRYYDRTHDRLADAQQHIKQSSGKSFMGGAFVRSRSSSKKTPAAPVPPPPQPAAKTSSSRRGIVQSKGNSKVKTREIVDPPSDYERDHDRSSDDRRGSKKTSTKTPQSARATTFREKAPEKSMPSIRRAATMPAPQQSSAGHTPAKSSTLRKPVLREESESSSSESSEDEAPPRRPPLKQATTTSRYRIDADSRAEVVEIMPKRPDPRRRETSPRNMGYDERDRPTSATHRRETSSRTVPTKPTRSATHTPTHSGDKKLFGEIIDTTGNYTSSPGNYSPTSVNYTPRITRDNIQYADYATQSPRRGSTDDRARRDSRDKEREAMAHMNNFRSPGMTRNQSFLRQEVNGAA